METQFSVTNYLLMFISIFSHYYLGKRIINSFFITTCLVGIAFSALVVGTLANICAGLIKYYIFITIITGFVLSIIDLLKNNNTVKYLFTYSKYIIIICFVLLFTNNPQKLFIENNNEDKTLLSFDDHQSYYSSQSTEMLNANYYSRLKVDSAYPYKWRTYHFFNGSTQAIVQGLVKHPGLFTFLLAQTILMVSIILSLYEQLLGLFKGKNNNYLFYLLWLIIGLTIFRHSLTWSLSTTQLFAVLSMGSIIFQGYKSKYFESIIFSFILGSASIRFLPISILSVIAILILNKDNINILLAKINSNIFVKSFLIIFIIYNYFTLFYPENIKTIIYKLFLPISGYFKDNMIQGEFFLSVFLLIFTIIIALFLYNNVIGNKKFYALQIINIKSLAFFIVIGCFIIFCNKYLSDNLFFVRYDWLPVLMVVKWLGLLMDYFSPIGIKLFEEFLNTYKVNFFGINDLTIYRFILVLISLIAIIWFLTNKIKLYDKIILIINKVKNYPYFVIAIFIVSPVFISFDYAFILLLSTIYIVSSYCIIQSIEKNILIDKKNSNYIFKYILIMIIGTKLYILTPVEPEISICASFITLDIMLFSLIGIYLVSKSINYQSYLKIIPLLIIVFLLKPNFILNIYSETTDEFPEVDISDIYTKDFKYSKYVDQNGFFIENNYSDREIDVFSSILGVYLKYDSSHKIKRNQWKKIEY